MSYVSVNRLVAELHFAVCVLQHCGILLKDREDREFPNGFSSLMYVYRSLRKHRSAKDIEVKVAGILENVPHNRYQDIGELDQCIMPNNNYPQFPMMTTMSS